MTKQPIILAVILTFFITIWLSTQIFHFYGKYTLQQEKAIKQEQAQAWFDYFYRDCVIDAHKRVGFFVQGNYLKQRYFIYDFSGEKYPADMQILTDDTLDITMPDATDPNYELSLDLKNKTCEFSDLSSSHHGRVYYDGKLGAAVQNRDSKIAADLIHNY
jgi:hypothetical protein